MVKKSLLDLETMSKSINVSSADTIQMPDMIDVHSFSMRCQRYHEWSIFANFIPMTIFSAVTHYGERHESKAHGSDHTLSPTIHFTVLSDS